MVISLFYTNKSLWTKLLLVDQSQFDNRYNTPYTFIPISLKSNIISDLMMFLGCSTSPLGYRRLVQPLSFRNSLLLDRENVLSPDENSQRYIFRMLFLPIPINGYFATRQSAAVSA